MEEHLKHVEILFQRLRQANLKLTARKCNFLKKHVQYLGHLISGEGIEPVPEKFTRFKRNGTTYHKKGRQKVPRVYKLLQKVYP